MTWACSAVVRRVVAHRSVACLASLDRVLLGAFVILAMLGAAGTHPLHAQGAFEIAGGADVSTMRLVREVATSRTYTGPILGAHGELSYRRLSLEGRYAEGTLTPEPGALGDGEDLVDAALLLRFHVRPWLALGAGPHLRAFVTGAGTSQWTRLESRARVEGEVINGLAYARFDAWYAVAVDVNVQGGGSGAFGGEGSLTVRLPRTPLAIRLSYAADRASFKSGGSELLEGVGLALVFGRY